MAQVSIARLFEDNREKLKLEWVHGRNGGAKSLNSALTKDSSRGLIGHLNFIHPNLIQVLGASEVAYLNGLDAAGCRSQLARTATHSMSCGWTLRPRTTNTSFNRPLMNNSPPSRYPRSPVRRNGPSSVSASRA